MPKTKAKKNDKPHNGLELVMSCDGSQEVIVALGRVERGFLNNADVNVIARVAQAFAKALLSNRQGTRNAPKKKASH
ncbi:MAG: hypothetical protein LAQ30_26750 [Acidobacteriia bacterium]|nr:hypothetical protein [Terriglobia bacterium]